MSNASTAEGPDLTNGIAADSVADGAILLGHVGGDEVVLARSGQTIFAIGAHCTHYRGPLAEGIVVGETIRCPLHHACFSLRTGEALRAPALDPVQCWRVDREGDRLFVREKIEKIESVATRPLVSGPQPAPSSIVIVGGGAAGLAAADMLRRKGYSGAVEIISADADAPVDRPNLSKDYLAGEAQEDWIPLWPPALFAERHIDLVLGRRVVALDPKARSITLDDGSRRPFGALLIATGADPVRIPVPGATDDQVRYLRTFADSKAIVERAKGAKRVVVLGASFIGLEVAASLRTRGIDVDVVAPDQVPLERVMGPEVGRFVQGLHEAKGVRFHLGQRTKAVAGRTVTLSGGSTIDADFLVLGVGVRPSTELAEQAGLTIDRGIAVSANLETSVPGIFAAGDNARWPDPHTGERIRVEHWVVAERQGQVAARNMLGERIAFDAVPFFWSQHYDVTIRYVGHAERWDSIKVDGSLQKQDCTVTYVRDGKALAIATVGRNRESLTAEATMEGT